MLPKHEDRRPRLLLVDDEPINLHVLRQILGEDYRLQFATDGRKALQLAQQQKPDLILLDIMMPELNGYDVCRQLKADPRTESIPVILCLRWRRWAMRPMALQPERWTTSSSPCVHLWCVPVCARTCRW